MIRDGYVFDGPEEILDLPASSRWPNRADRRPVFSSAIASVTLQGDWAQFGVYQGRTAQSYLLPNLPPESTLWLFDSFNGLPEPWDKGSSIEPEGKYQCAPVSFGHRTKTIVGLFEDVLHGYSTGDPWALIDIDCDLYSASRTVLYEMNDRIVPGTIIRFDELFSYPKWRDHEWKALNEWRSEFGRKVRWLDRGAIYWAACVVEQ